MKTKKLNVALAILTIAAGLSLGSAGCKKNDAGSAGSASDTTTGAGSTAPAPTPTPVPQP